MVTATLQFSSGERNLLVERGLNHWHNKNSDTQRQKIHPKHHPENTLHAELNRRKHLWKNAVYIVNTGIEQFAVGIDEDSPSLIQSIKSGDRETFALLFSHFKPRLWRFVNLRLHPQLRGRLDPEDVLQECWLRAVNRIDYFPNSVSPAGFIWFRMVLTQTLIDLQRRHLGAEKRSTGRELSLFGGWNSDETSASMAIQLSAQLTSPSCALARQELTQQLGMALQGLDEIDREILALRHFEELTNAEAAMTLNLSEQASSKRYVRALHRLKGILEVIPDLGPLGTNRFSPQ
jgi:RNA polymerase sigma-70 factor (ECF subfamily)